MENRLKGLRRHVSPAHAQHVPNLLQLQDIAQMTPNLACGATNFPIVAVVTFVVCRDYILKDIRIYIASFPKLKGVVFGDPTLIQLHQ